MTSDFASNFAKAVDIDTVFLCGDIEEETYMEYPKVKRTCEKMTASFGQVYPQPGSSSKAIL